MSEMMEINEQVRYGQIEKQENGRFKANNIKISLNIKFLNTQIKRDYKICLKSNWFMSCRENSL